MNKQDEANSYWEQFQAQFPRYDIIVTSVSVDKGGFQALSKKGLEKWLVLGADTRDALPSGFSGELHELPDGCYLICNVNHENAEALRSFLPFTKPVTLGSASSFGFGDRLGNAGTAHLKSLMDGEPVFKPIVAQQSIRELDRTERSAEEVMDAATWAVFESGYRDGFGSDGDHLKTRADIDRMIGAGYTMFTIDPSDHVDNRSVDMNGSALEEAFENLPWKQLEDSPGDFLKRYVDQTFQLRNDITLKPTKEDILRAAVKYGRVVEHTRNMFRYLKESYPTHDSEVELSVDETPHPTKPEEHLIIASELQRLGVVLVSLAPRFCGDFEKGIDFKGHLDEFKSEYLLHQAIAAGYGAYKLSVHSGSDKFSVYEAIGELGEGTVHVKTAGTSYLEALRAVAISDAELFRDIITLSLKRFDTDRATYHISADLDRFGNPDDISDDQLPDLLDDDNARQIFHVTFGSILTNYEENGRSGLKQRLLKALSENEKLYHDCLFKHFRRHVRPFENMQKFDKQ